MTQTISSLTCKTPEILGTDAINICLSGGAEGADLLFGICATSVGYEVVHWSFKAHKSVALDQSTVAILDDEQLAIADEFCLQASKTLKRYFPPKSMYVRNLLRRNYYQVAWAASVYAISTIENNVVQGGTAWAVAMFLQRFDFAPCPCFVFCQDTGYWHAWNGAWEPIARPAMPSGVFAGIGTRKLNSLGKSEIINLFDLDIEST